MNDGNLESEHRRRAGSAGAFFARLGNAVDLTDEETAVLAQLLAGPATIFERGQDLIGWGDPVERAYVVLDGWAIWQDIHTDGSRQVLDFFLPGDAIALGATVARDRLGDVCGIRTPHHVTALTSVGAVSIERHTFAALDRSHPGLGSRLLALAFIDRADRFRRRMINFGRASVRARTADLLLELWERLQAAGHARGNHYSLPASQLVLADLLRVAPSYLSRVLAELEHDRIVTVQSSGERMVVIHDPERLRDVAIEEHEAGGPLNKKW